MNWTEAEKASLLVQLQGILADPESELRITGDEIRLWFCDGEYRDYPIGTLR